MQKFDILNVGIGECGCNIVNELINMDTRYNGLFLNSNMDDVKRLKNAKDVYIIARSKGTGKNRTYGKQIFIEDRKNILDQIFKYETQSIINLYFGMGGGTGSSIAPALIKSLKLLEINKTINVICVIPGFNEDKRYRKNALECWEELIKLDNINSFYILDNNKRKNNRDINKEFAQQFDTFMSMPMQEKTDNVIDEEELGIVSSCKGATIFYTLPDEKKDAKIALAIAEKDSIFAELNENTSICKYLGISINKENYDYKEIAKQFKIDEYMVSAYNKKKSNLNLVAETGCKLGKISIELLEESIKEDEEDTKEEENTSVDLSIGSDINTKQKTKSVNNNMNEEDIEEKLNNDSLWNKFLDM